MSYLEHQVDFGAHVLGFRSTHQYYKTAKYQLHRTIGDGALAIFVGSDDCQPCSPSMVIILYYWAVELPH